METKTYKCQECGHETVVKASAAVPDCCGKKMREIPLDPCVKAHNAENARLSDSDEACDDGVR